MSGKPAWRQMKCLQGKSVSNILSKFHHSQDYCYLDLNKVPRRTLTHTLVSIRARAWGWKWGAWNHFDSFAQYQLLYPTFLFLEPSLPRFLVFAGNSPERRFIGNTCATQMVISIVLWMCRGNKGTIANCHLILRKSDKFRPRAVEGCGQTSWNTFCYWHGKAYRSFQKCNMPV